MGGPRHLEIAEVHALLVKLRPIATNEQDPTRRGVLLTTVRVLEELADSYAELRVSPTLNKNLFFGIIYV